MNNSKILEKKLSRTIDQRSKVIDVVWVPNSSQISQPITVAGISVNEESNDLIENIVKISGKDKVLSRCIVDMLKSAKSTAILCSFLLADESVENAINEAAERGVRIYLMLACETRLDNDTPDDEFGKMCLTQHQAMLERLAGKIMIRSAPHFHAKAVLIDAIGSNSATAKGLLLTANLTTEALERNEELAINLSLPEIQEMVDILKWAFFENAQHQMLDNEKFDSVTPLGELKHPVVGNYILTTTNQSHSIHDHALELIQHAKHQLVISSFGWQEDHPITDAICDKAKSGTNVVILARIRPGSMKALIKLRSAGAKVCGFKWLHAKAIWNDSNYAMIMSANLQHHGLDSGFEIGVRLIEDRAKNLQRCLLHFLNNNHSQLLLNTPIGDIKGSATVWDSNNFTEINIGEKTIQNLNPIVASCASNLNSEPAIPTFSCLDLPFHEIEYQWTIKAPTLPKNAVEVFKEERVSLSKENSDGKKRDKEQHQLTKRSYIPKVFILSGKKHVIAIEHENEINSAIELRNHKFKQANIVMLSA